MGQQQSIPGVVYSQDWVPPTAEQFPFETGTLNHVMPETLPQSVRDNPEWVEVTRNRPGPEVQPYTFWERTGAVPINVGRLRPRQFYMPTTDFSRYSYDEISPEERRLKARWIARLFEVSWQYPAAIWACACTIGVVMPTTVRLPFLVGSSITAVFAEAQRTYIAAAREKLDLDDYLVAKEVWYIKNVETRELRMTTIGGSSDEDAKAYEDRRYQEKMAELEAELDAVRSGLYADAQAKAQGQELPVPPMPAVPKGATPLLPAARENVGRVLPGVVDTLPSYTAPKDAPHTGLYNR